jgi:endonuclease/exonuclease/phosphatase (EEP) superfamily protein YafD
MPRRRSDIGSRDIGSRDIGSRATARLCSGAAAAALGAAATVVLLPDRLRVGNRFPFVDAVAWRPHAALAALATGAALTIRPLSRPAGVVVGAIAAAGLVEAVRHRLTGRRPAAAGPAATGPAVPGVPTELTVLSFNALHGRADTGELATVIERCTPDFVALPEAGPDFCDKLMALVDILGYRSAVSTSPGSRDGESVTLLAGPRAAGVQLTPSGAMWLPHVEASGGLLGRRTLYAVHPVAPVRPSRTVAWRRDLALLARWCRAPVAPIVAGDFNATFDHDLFRMALGGCRSAAAGTGRGLVGTFPASLPRWFGIQIDHVLIPADAVTSRFEIVDIGGSDHRAVLATFTVSC